MGNDAPKPTRQLGREPSPPDASQQEPAQRGKLAGYTVGNYHLQALLGVGGMAEVYRAQDLGLSRTVAVKILFGQLAADPGYVARFRAEARRVATLKHPHIVQVFAYGEEAINGQKLLYLVMPLLQESLRHVLLREGRLPSDRATQLALQIAQALGAAHATGLVHRDVKPENILLDEERQALLGDFGIARELGGTSRRNATLAGTGLPVGTPEYMAPEQLRGGNVDQRADLYSLGAVLYELLTAVTPFTGETPYDVASRVLTATLVPPSVQVLSIPPALERVVLTAMAREPAERYATASTMEQALREALAAPSAEVRLQGAIQSISEQPTESMLVATTERARRVSKPRRSGAPDWGKASSGPTHRARVLFALACVIALVAAGAGALLVTVQPWAPSTVFSSPSATRPTLGVAEIDTTPTHTTPTTGGQLTATPAPARSPTAAASPTPESTSPAGGILNLEGTILSVNSGAGTFSYRLSSGASITVVTNTQTQFTGSTHKFSGLRPGWTATITGHYQANGTFLATQVVSHRQG